MHQRGRAELEDEIRRRVAASDLEGATTVALRGYGSEILRFLHALHASEAAAADVFSRFAEGVWRGLEAFDWSSSFRSWAFGIARRTSLRARRDEGRRAARERPLELHPEIANLVERVRSETLSFLRTDRRNRFTQIRDALPPEDRALLLLRVDQGLSWLECASVLHEGEAWPDPAGARREAARLRKRYQLLKARLLEIGRREGLVRPPDEPD